MDKLEIIKLEIIPLGNSLKKCEKLREKISSDETINIIEDWNNGSITFESSSSYFEFLLQMSKKTKGIRITYKYYILDEDQCGVYIFEDGEYITDDFDNDELKRELIPVENEDEGDNSSSSEEESEESTDDGTMKVLAEGNGIFIKSWNRSVRGMLFPIGDNIVKNNVKKEEKQPEKNPIDPRTIITVKEMLKDRGYSIYSDLSINNNGLTELIGKKGDEEDKFIHCIWKIDKGKLNVKQIGEIRKYIDSKDIKHCMIIHLTETVSSKIMEIIKNYKFLKEIDIEFYPYENLKINPTKHVLVPKHELVDYPTAKEIKAKHGKFLPLMLSSDAIAKYYGFVKGDIVKITRRNGLVVHRLVV